MDEHEEGSRTGARDAPDVPGYTVRSLLGRGGSGEVWSAVPEQGGAPCVVKVLTRSDDLEQALREASLLREIRHDHVLRLLDVVVLPGAVAAVPGAAAGGSRLVLVLELAEGGSLSQLVHARGHLSPGELVTALSPVCAAMGDLHRGGVVHGDLSPGNVLFTEDGRPLVADLGVARIVGEGADTGSGTAGFAAPELLDGMMPSPASDAYSLGALAWLCLTGAPPAPAALRESLPELAPGTPAEMVEVIDRALAGDPTRRPDADTLATALFDAAPASAVRLAPGLDAAQGITYRIRAGAGSVPPPAADTERRAGSWRRALVVATVAGLVVGGGAGGGAAWWQHTHDRVGVARPAADATPAPQRVAPPAGHPRSPTEPPQPPSPPTTKPPPLLQTRAAARASPRKVLTRLVSGRAAAWRRGTVAHLAGALAPGSPALERDRRALRRVQRAGARYAGLTFTVERAEVVSASPGRVRITARVKRSAYRLVRGGRPAAVRVPPETSRAVFDLRWTGDGWRLADWS